MGAFLKILFCSFLSPRGAKEDIVSPRKHALASAYHAAGTNAGLPLPALDELISSESGTAEEVDSEPSETEDNEELIELPATPTPNLPSKVFETTPPKDMSMRWYKTHGWYDFFIGRWVVFYKGRFAGQPCQVINFNGNNTRCRFADGYHCINVDIPLSWN